MKRSIKRCSQSITVRFVRMNILSLMDVPMVVQNPMDSGNLQSDQICNSMETDRWICASTLKSPSTIDSAIRNCRNLIFITKEEVMKINSIVWIFKLEEATFTTPSKRHANASLPTDQVQFSRIRSRLWIIATACTGNHLKHHNKSPGQLECSDGYE